MIWAKRVGVVAVAALAWACSSDRVQPQEPEVGTRLHPRPSTIVTPAAAPNPPLVYVTNSGSPSRSVSVIQTATNTVVATVDVRPQHPVGVAITPDGAFAYVATGFGPVQLGRVVVIETASNSVATEVGVGFIPHDVAITPDGAFAYVANSFSRTVSVIATATNTVVATVNVTPAVPIGVAITPDGAFVYVTNQGGPFTVVVIETATNTVVDIVRGLGVSPQGVAITPDGAFAYVTNANSNTVSVIETASNTVMSTVGVGPVPVRVAITADGAFAYVANNGLQRRDDGSFFGTASVIKTAGNTVVATVEVGVGPAGVAITPLNSIEVDIDIKPGSEPNCVNKDSKGRTPAAVIASEDFDPFQVDPVSVQLEGVSALRWSLDKDVNGDGLNDLVLHFSTQQLNATGELFDGNTLELTGALKEDFGGTPIAGADVVYLAGGPNCLD